MNGVEREIHLAQRAHTDWAADRETESLNKSLMSRGAGAKLYLPNENSSLFSCTVTDALPLLANNKKEKIYFVERERERSNREEPRDHLLGVTDGGRQRILGHGITLNISPHCTLSFLQLYYTGA